MANVARINPEGIRRYMKGYASGGDVREQPTFPAISAESTNAPILPASGQPVFPSITPESVNPQILAADQQPRVPVRLGFAGGGTVIRDLSKEPPTPIVELSKQPPTPIVDLSKQPAPVILPPTEQPTLPVVNPADTNPQILSVDKQPHFPVRLGFSNAGRIPGKVNPNVADDVTIDAKKGEYVLPVEVVGAMGGPDAIDAMVKNIKTKMGVPAEVGPKMRNEPDAHGRMNAKGMRGFAGGGTIGGFTGPYADMLAQQAYVDELARGAELPNRAGVRVGTGSQVVNTSPAVPVGTPYPPNPNMLPAVRPVVDVPGPNSRARGFSLGAEGATTSPARPVKAPLQIEYGIEGGSKTVPSRGPRPVAPAADVYQDTRTMTGTGARPFVNNKALGFISKLTNSPVAKGLGMAGAASQIYTGAQKLMRGEYLEGGNDMLAGGGFFAGPVGKAYSAGNAVGTVLNSGINALGLGVDPNSGGDGSYTPEQQAVLDRSAEVKRQMAAGFTPRAATKELDVNDPAWLANATKNVPGFGKQRDMDLVDPTQRAGAATTPEQDEASRLAARNALEAGYAKSAAEQDAVAELLRRREKTAGIEMNIKNLNDSIAQEAQTAAYYAGQGNTEYGIRGLAASKIRMDALNTRLTSATGQQVIDVGSERENIKGGFGLKEQALRNEGAVAAENVRGGFSAKDREMAAETLKSTRLEEAKIRQTGALDVAKEHSRGLGAAALAKKVEKETEEQKKLADAEVAQAISDAEITGKSVAEALARRRAGQNIDNEGTWYGGKGRKIWTGGRNSALEAELKKRGLS